MVKGLWNAIQNFCNSVFAKRDKTKTCLNVLVWAVVTITIATAFCVLVVKPEKAKYDSACNLPLIPPPNHLPKPARKHFDLGIAITSDRVNLSVSLTNPQPESPPKPQPEPESPPNPQPEPGSPPNPPEPESPNPRSPNPKPESPNPGSRNNKSASASCADGYPRKLIMYIGMTMFMMVYGTGMLLISGAVYKNENVYEIWGCNMIRGLIVIVPICALIYALL